MYDSRKMLRSTSPANYVARAQAYALFAQALTNDQSSYVHQLEQVTDPYAVITELTSLLVGCTEQHERADLADELHEYLAQILDELAEA